MTLAIRGLGTALPANRLPQMELAEAAKQLLRRGRRAAADARPPVPAHRDRDPARRLPGGASSATVMKGGPPTRCSSHTASRTTAARPPPSGWSGTTRRPCRWRRGRAARPWPSPASPPAEITHLVTVSCTGFAAPGVDVGLIKGLGLRPTTVRTNVGFMGCHGAINGLRAAAGYTGADPKARVLMCCVELSSLHFYYGWNPKRMVGNALFADGSAAVVGAPADAAGATGRWRPPGRACSRTPSTP